MKVIVFYFSAMRWTRAAAILLILLSTSSLEAKSNSHKKLGGLFSPGTMDVSGTAGVRGGDVMGDAIKKATPNAEAVFQMEQHSIAPERLSGFQREGKIGRYAK